MTREALEGFPATVPKRNAEGTRLYERAQGTYAAKEPLDRARVHIRAELGEGWQACEGSPPDDLEAASIAPLYRLGNGSPCLLTGRVFVVARSADCLESSINDFESLGFRVEDRPRSAPAGAWLTPVEEDPAAALSAIRALSELDAMEFVQPEAISERQPRG